MAKKFLDDHGIKYEEFNIVEDKAARDEMKNKCKSLAVPTICFNDEVIIGFNEVELRKKLGL
jgi:glutaredoxin